MLDPVLPDDAGSILGKCGDYVLDDSPIAVYCLGRFEEGAVLSKCADAEESYAREVLNWPNGRLAKPSIFRPSATALDNLDTCIQHFIRHLGFLLAQVPCEGQKELAVYPFAFVVFNDDDSSGDATAILALESDDGKWILCSCKIPVDVDLGLELTSLRMGDVSTQDLAEKYSVSLLASTV